MADRLAQTNHHKNAGDLHGGTKTKFKDQTRSEIHCPLFGKTNLNPKENDIPADLILIDGRNE